MVWPVRMLGHAENLAPSVSADDADVGVVPKRAGRRRFGQNWLSTGYRLGRGNSSIFTVGPAAAESCDPAASSAVRAGPRRLAGSNLRAKAGSL